MFLRRFAGAVLGAHAVFAVALLAEAQLLWRLVTVALCLLVPLAALQAASRRSYGTLAVLVVLSMAGGLAFFVSFAAMRIG